MVVEIATSLPVNIEVDTFCGSLVIAASLCNSVLLYHFDAHIRMNVLDIFPLDQVIGLFSREKAETPPNIQPAKEEPNPSPIPLPNSDDEESFAMTRKMLNP